MLDTANIQRLENALLIGVQHDNSHGAFKELVRSMANEGLSQAAICHVFDSFGRYLNNAGRHDDAGFIWVAIECIVGWKSKASCFFDHYLTKEEYEGYLRSIGAPVRPIFWAET